MYYIKEQDLLKFNLSLQKKICLYIIGFTLITTVTLSYFLYREFQAHIMFEINTKLLSNVAIAALKVNTDLHDSIRSRDDETGEPYLQLKMDFQNIRDAAKNIRYVYSMRKNKNDKISFVVDAEEKPEETAHVNEVYNDASNMLKANFATMNTSIVEKEFYTDKWGTWITAYAPFFSSDGKRSGILGMDISARTINEGNREILLITFLVFICTTIPFCALGWFFGHRLTAPLIELKKNLTENFEEDSADYSIVEISDCNEVGVLAAGFNTMAVKLKDTIKSLKLEITARKKIECQLKKTHINTLELIVKILDEHEASTAEHSTRVPSLALILAKEMGINDKVKLINIQYSALLHDIGKISISDTILKKPSKLTDEEMNEIKKHPQTGYNIVNTVSFLQETANIILSHHERYDGKGYPQGLAGEDICIGARIFAVVDTFDAIVSNRCYRKTLTAKDALKEINRCSGTQFHPKVVTAFNNCYLKIVSLYEKNHNIKINYKSLVN